MSTSENTGDSKVASTMTEEDKQNEQTKETQTTTTTTTDAFSLTIEPPKSPPGQQFKTPVPSMINRPAKRLSNPPTTTQQEDQKVSNETTTSTPTTTTTEPATTPTTSTTPATTPSTTTSTPATKALSVEGSTTITPFTKDDKTGMATMAGRRHKVALAPGHSHMDWMRKTNTASNLSGTNGQMMRVNRTELRKHNTVEDCWTVIRGKVYNITPYLSFHPGGVDEMMKGAGRDGTKLFDHKHAWVNVDGFLAKCLVGIFLPND